MKNRIIGFIVLVASIFLAYLVWNNLSGGEGPWRNVLRNGIIGFLILPTIYSFVLLFGNSNSNPPNDKNDVKK
jgi:hypothetical protein